MSDWDVFISHASEDKQAVVNPLVDALRKAGLRVWLDSQELMLGDSLRRKIEEGLVRSRFGVVVLSPAFFRKEWPQRELEAILALEAAHGKRVLPVLHDLSVKALTTLAPLLADKVAVSSSQGVPIVASEILRALGRPIEDPFETHRSLERPHDLIGMTVGGYTLERVVGIGGSGIVFRSSSPTWGAVAVKLFYPLRKGYQHLYGMFDRGFRALQAIRHPAVVAPLGSGSVELSGERSAFLVTEFVAGPSLTEWKSQCLNPVTTLEQIRMACELADAFAACHATTFIDEVGFQVRGVLHGDIKPANVLVDATGHPRVVDFLQLDVQRLIDPRIMSPELSEPHFPKTGALGTPGFMAPEQERHGLVSEATDIYGLGVTLTAFFSNETGPIWLVFASNSGLHPDLKQLLLSMMHNEPGERPRSMADVSKALKSIHESESKRQLPSLPALAARARELLTVEPHPRVLELFVKEGVHRELAQAAIDDALRNWRSRR
jgi:hypothetical protein